MFLIGYEDGTFGPENYMTRAEVVTMFARLVAEPMDTSKTYSSSFNDVSPNYWAANYIGYMEQYGIIIGYEDGSFRPEEPVSRAEFATIVSRFDKLSGDCSSSFPDVSDDYWAATYIGHAAERGWVIGYEDGTFRPENFITRAEVAAVTCRMLERNGDQSYIRSHMDALRTFSDIDESHWAYWYVMESANAHGYITKGETEAWTGLKE